MANPIFNMTLKAAKEGFFRPNEIRSAVERARRKKLSLWGQFVRKSARQSIKNAPKTTRSAKYAYDIQTRQAVSLPGNPPLSHTGVLKQFILSSYDQATKSQVVGPTVVNQVGHRGPQFRTRVKGLVPEILEYGRASSSGGIISIFEVQNRDGRWVRADLRSRRRIAERPQRWRTVRIEARPYMRPAAERESTNPKLHALWANSVKAA